MNGLKEAFSRENLLKDLNFFALLNLGLVLTAVGIVYFKNPNHFAFGGTSGLSILLADLFPRINVGGFMWIINIVLVVLGFIFLGIKCMGWTIYSSFALSFFVSCCEWLYPSGVSLSGDAMLDLVFAVFLPALGAAIVFDIGASTGGTDIVAMLLQKFAGIKFSSGIFLADGFVVLSGLAVIGFGLGTGEAASNGWMLTLYSLITIYITSRVIAYLLNGASYDKLLFIISDHHQALKRFIIEDLDRSATYIKSKGMYTDASRDMIFLVVSRKEVHLVQHKIKEIDPAAFVVVTDAYETFGEGFKQFPDKNEIHAE